MRIGIINDLTGIAELLKRMVGVDPANRVVWIALNGAAAVELCAKETPDLILMGLLEGLADMDCVEATRRIMARTPCAIVIVTGSVQVNAARIFEAMGHGALDVVDMPASGTGDLQDSALPLLAKIATVSSLIGEKDSARRSPASGNGASERLLRQPLIAIGAGPLVLVFGFLFLPPVGSSTPGQDHDHATEARPIQERW